MRTAVFLIILFLTMQTACLSSPVVYGENGKFGLKNEAGETVTDAVYKKLIKLGESGWLIQSGSKFGIIDNDGVITVKPVYSRANILLGRYAKLRNGTKEGLFDETGKEILPVEYSSIDLLFGGMFLICKNYKYGIADFDGNIILEPVFEDIYTPNPHLLVIVNNGKQYDIEMVHGVDLTLPDEIKTAHDNYGAKTSELISNPMVTTGYYGVSAANYLLKIISSISPAYEETIDELMFSQGADAAAVIIKCTWIPQFPFVYAKKYYQILTAPNNGPLGTVKSNLKKEITE